MLLLELAPESIPVDNKVQGIEPIDSKYKVKRVLSVRKGKKKNKLKYLIKWKGYDYTENT